MPIISIPGLETVIHNDNHFQYDSEYFHGCPRTFLYSKYVNRGLFEVNYLVRQSKIWEKTVVGLIGRPSENLGLRRLINVRSTEVHVRERVNTCAPEEAEIISSADYHFKINRPAEANVFAIVAHYSKETAPPTSYVMSCVIVPIEDQVYVPLTAGKGHKCKGDFLIKGRHGTHMFNLSSGLNLLTKTHMHRVINLLNLYKTRVLGVYNTHKLKN